MGNRQQSNDMKPGGHLRLFAFVVGLAAVALVMRSLPIKQHLASLIERLETLGAWGPVLVAVVYVPACLLFVPGSLLTLGAGFAFGLVPATIAVSVGSVVGATAAFFVGRTVAREAVAARIAKDRRFRAIDQAVAQQGFRIVLLLRLSPLIPFNVLNYALGLTKVSLRDYVLASWIGMLPATVAFVYLGSAVKNVADLAAGKVEGDMSRHVLFGLGLVATIVVTWWVTRLARQALRGVGENTQPVAPAAVGAPAVIDGPTHV
jgi:uncharacterized membrane protein YdjX (TVP38/TMEM64 family)